MRVKRPRVNQAAITLVEAAGGLSDFAPCFPVGNLKLADVSDPLECVDSSHETTLRRSRNPVGKLTGRFSLKYC